MKKNDMSAFGDRLHALRIELARQGLDGFVVPMADEHMSEYVGAYARRLAWLTGFKGSAGWAVVLADKAAVFVDGRYTSQVRQQVDERLWNCHFLAHSRVTEWLANHAPAGGRIGYDPWLHTRDWALVARDALAQVNARLVEVDLNPVDAVWTDQPPPSAGELIAHPDHVAGQPSIGKRRAIVEWLAARKADATILCALDSIAWTFNLRGSDIDHTPVAFAFAIIHANGVADLFVGNECLADGIVEHLGRNVRIHPRKMFEEYLGTLSGRKVLVDPRRTVAAIYRALETAGAEVLEARDPVVLPKAVKNAAEIAGHRAAQARDGAALVSFLHWFSVEAPKGNLTELSAAARLGQFRRATGELRGQSFETISASGANGAIIHYRPARDTNRKIEPGTLYLLDSGGQYLDGTTDVTRTIAVGSPGAEMRDRFTRVLKGHITLARAIFPSGTRGIQLDILARQHLWASGMDYAHGTGHGVGSFLAVHEGPQSISPTMSADEPLVPGMILSNEPGYYKAGEYGIRIENLMLVVEREIPGAEREMLGFEILSFAPIDRTLIDIAMLTPDERAWIDSYHADVARIVGSRLQGAAKQWLENATRALA